MRETARKIFGNELAEVVHDIWAFDDEGETTGMWRRNLALCPFYLRLLGLQIKAIEVGLMEA